MSESPHKESLTSDMDDVIKKRPREDAEMDITPMIDIVFLLLIFFIVASKIEKSASGDLPKARHGSQVSTTEALEIFVKKGDGDRALVERFDGTLIEGDDEQQSELIGEYIEAGIAGTAPFDLPKKNIIIRAEAGVRHGEIDRISKAIGGATELETLYVAVLQIQ